MDVPTQVVTDNAAQFTSQEFEEFLKSNGIQHYKSAPYHLAINGEAECYVQTFKTTNCKMRSRNFIYQTDEISLFLSDNSKCYQMLPLSGSIKCHMGTNM